MKRAKKMDVCVQVDLGVPPEKCHLAERHGAAYAFTDDRASVHVSVPPEQPMCMIAAFTIPKAREMDVVDGIMKRFALFMEDYQNQTVWFPKKPH